jgi:hypothetical protein
VLCGLPVASWPLVGFDCEIGASAVATVLSGGTYFNVHTAANPGGACICAMARRSQCEGIL